MSTMTAKCLMLCSVVIFVLFCGQGGGRMLLSVNLFSGFRQREAEFLA